MITRVSKKQRISAEKIRDKSSVLNNEDHFSFVGDKATPKMTATTSTPREPKSEDMFQEAIKRIESEVGEDGAQGAIGGSLVRQ